jgi:uncharacterized membrane protein HdeD (DUF308 family)
MVADDPLESARPREMKQLHGRTAVSAALVMLLGLSALWPPGASERQATQLVGSILVGGGALLAVFSLALGTGAYRRLLAIAVPLAGFGGALLTTYLTVGPWVFAAMLAVAFALGIGGLLAPRRDSRAM